MGGQPLFLPAFGSEGGSSHEWDPQHTFWTAQDQTNYIHTQAESQGANLSAEDSRQIGSTKLAAIVRSWLQNLAFHI